MVMEPESAGMTTTIVVPGSADDPFTRGAAAVAQPTAQPPVIPAAQPTNTTVVQPPVQVQQVDQNAKAPPTQAEIDAIVAERVGKATSTLDRRLNALTKELENQQATAEAQRIANVAAVRAAQTNGLRADQVADMQKVWEQEDRLAALETREKAVVDLYRSTEGLRLLTTYGEFGIEEDDILGYTGDPTQLEDFVKGLAFEKMRAGGTSAGSAAKQVAAAAAEGDGAKPNAGQQDIGSGGMSAVGAKMLTTTGLGSMAANVKTLFNDPSGRPW